MAEVITVSALNRYVKTLLDANDALFDLALRGEIANFVQNARSGHCYFSLRDDVCSVKAVMFRTDERYVPGWHWCRTAGVGTAQGETGAGGPVCTGAQKAAAGIS